METLLPQSQPNKLKRTWKFILKFKKTAIVLVIVIALIGWFLLQRGGAADQEAITVQEGSVVQEVNVNGRVSSANSVEIAFQTSGRVAYVGVEAGQRVSAGQILVRLDNTSLLAQRQKELANVRLYEVKLNQVIAASNTQPVDASSVASNDLVESFKIAVDAMIDFTDLQYTYFNTTTAEDNKLASAKEEALKAMYGQIGLGRTGSWYFTTLTTGLKSKIDTLEKDPTSLNTSAITDEVRNVLSLSRSALEQIRSRLAGVSEATTTDKAKAATALDNVLDQMASLTTQEKAIIDDTFDIEAARSQLEQAKASLGLIDVEIAKNSLIAPFSGTVTNIEAEPGETVSTNTPVVSMISNAKFEIEADVSEADIAKLDIGIEADVTLDAYGRDRIFSARIVHIDPAGTVSEGVATYRIVLEFQDKTEDILDGMTADIDLRTAQKENVVYVPTREIITKNARRYVRRQVTTEEYLANFSDQEIISETDTHKVIEVEVQTGLKGSDGRTEIITGLKEGDTIVTR